MAEVDEVKEAEQSIDHTDTEHHISPKVVPLWRIVLLSAVGGAIDLIVAVEAVYAAPLLVAAGLDIQYASIMLGLSPIFGIMFQSYHGTISDHCQCNWGRRRPFILVFTLSACIGLGVAPFAPYFSELNSISGKYLSVAFTAIGILIMDFSWGQLQLPSRAYLLDCIPTSQSQVGNFIYVLLIGVGTCIGYAFGGIDWAYLFNREVNVINEAQVVYGLTIIIVLVSLVCTLLSVKEKPYHNEDLATTGFSKCCPCVKSPKDCLKNFCTTILDSFKFFFYMSKQMWILWFAVFFAFASIFAMLLFFSTFVGQSIYGGIQDAPVETKAYQLYTEGVRMSAWALAVGGGSLTIMSLLFDAIAKRIGLKTLFLLIQYALVLILFMQTIFINIVVAFLVACFGLLFQGVYLAVPFALLSFYQDDNIMFRKPIPGQSATDNVQGRACYVINTAIYLSQIVAAFITGPFIKWFQTATASIMLSCIFGAVATIFSIFVEVPNNK